MTDKRRFSIFVFETPGWVIPTSLWNKSTISRGLCVEWTSCLLRYNKPHGCSTFPEELGQTLFLIAVMKIPSDKEAIPGAHLLVPSHLVWLPMTIIQQAPLCNTLLMVHNDLSACRYPTPKSVSGPNLLRRFEPQLHCSPTEQWFKQFWVASFREQM